MFNSGKRYGWGSLVVVSFVVGIVLMTYAAAVRYGSVSTNPTHVDMDRAESLYRNCLQSYVDSTKNDPIHSSNEYSDVSAQCRADAIMLSTFETPITPKVTTP
jgi:hypothetical protein